MNFSKDQLIKAGIFSSVFFAGVLTCKITGAIRKSVRAHKAAKAAREVTGKPIDVESTAATPQ